MYGDVLLIVFLVLVFGCAAFFFGVIYMVCQAIAWAGRGVFGVFKTTRPANARRCPSRRSAARVCPRKQCRRAEYRRDARYCSQCGAPLP